MPLVSIDDNVMANLRSLLKTTSPVEVTTEALRRLQWAANEAREGRTILSSDPKGTVIHRLEMPSLAKVVA